MTQVREVMSPRVTVVDDDSNIEQAAAVLAQSDLGAVPVRGASDGHLKGMLTDRDIVVKVVAIGRTPSTVTVREIANEEVVTVAADDPVEEAIAAMKRHKLRRLPVLEGHVVTGIITQTDVVRARPDKVAELLSEISS